MNFFENSKKYLKSICRSKCWDKGQKFDVLIIGNDAHYAAVLDGKSYSPLIDSWRFYYERIGKTTAVILRPISLIDDKQVLHEVYKIDRRYLPASLFIYLDKKFKHKLIFISKIRLFLETEIWIRIYNEVKCSNVIAIQPNAAMCTAAHKLGISITDIQHGAITDEQSCYGEAYCSKMDQRKLPSHYFVWDEQSASVIKAWASNKNIEVTVTGNLWVNRFKAMHPSDLEIEKFIRNSPIHRSKRPVILVTLENGLENYCSTEIFDGIMLKAVKELILAGNINCSWFVRLHPNQYRSYSRTTITNYMVSNFGHLSNVEWRNSTIEPLPVLLSNSDLHITHSSSTVIEACMFGVRTALLSTLFKSTMRNYYIDQRMSGMAEIVSCESSKIYEWINVNLVNCDGQYNY